MLPANGPPNTFVTQYDAAFGDGGRIFLVSISIHLYLEWLVQKMGPQLSFRFFSEWQTVV